MAFIAPVIGWMTTNAATISTVASVASAGVGAVGAIAGAQSQSAQIEANAKQMEQAASDRRVASSVEAEKLRRKQRVALSRDGAMMAEAGAMSGTSLDLLDQNRVSAELDALTVQYNGETAASGLDRQAELDRAEASGVRTGGYLTAAGRVGTGIGSIDPLNFSSKRPSGSVAPVY